MVEVDVVAILVGELAPPRVARIPLLSDVKHVADGIGSGLVHAMEQGCHQSAFASLRCSSLQPTNRALFNGLPVGAERGRPVGEGY